MIYISNHHEAIIDRILWNRTQEELKKRSSTVTQKEKYSNRYWCSGKLYCGICGRRFVSRTKKCKNGTVYKAWRCFATAKHEKFKSVETDADGVCVGCKNQSYNEKSLLTSIQYTIGYMQDNVGDLKKEIISEIKKVQKEPKENTYTSKISKLKEQIEIYHEKKRKVLDLLLSDLIDMEEVKKQNAWYDEKIEELEKQLFQLSKVEEIQKYQTKQMEEYLFVLDEIMDFSCKKNSAVPEQMYREVLEKMVLYPEGKLQIFLKGLPFAVEMKIQTFGRMEQYQTEILEVRIANKVILNSCQSLC